jgi:hypothetical protein
VLLDRPKGRTPSLEHDARQAALRRTRNRFAGLHFKDSFVAGAQEAVLLFLVVDGAREVRALLAVGDEPAAGNIQEYCLVIVARVVEVKRAFVRQIAEACDALRLAATAIVECTKDGEDDRAREEGAGRQDRKPKELTTADELVSLAMVGKLLTPGRGFVSRRRRKLVHRTHGSSDGAVLRRSSSVRSEATSRNWTGGATT